VQINSLILLYRISISPTPKIIYIYIYVCVCVCVCVCVAYIRDKFYSYLLRICSPRKYSQNCNSATPWKSGFHVVTDFLIRGIYSTYLCKNLNIFCTVQYVK